MSFSDADNGISKSAILLLSLGEEEASEVFKFLKPKEVQSIGREMAKVSDVSREVIDIIAQECISAAETSTTLGMDSNSYIRGVLTKALGEDKAGLLLDRILQDSDTSGIESLKWMEPSAIAELIKNEHPQIIATILVHLERDLSAAVLNMFMERLRSDVILRIATLEGIQPNALSELNDVLGKALSGGEKIQKTTMGGIRTAAEILNYVGSTSEKTVLDDIRTFDTELCQKIQDEMFTFDNLLDLEDSAIQSILREAQTDQLIVALKGTDDAIKEKVFKNMSKRAGEALREDLDGRGPVRLSEVETAQKSILKVVRTLADSGEIVMSSGGDDAFV